MFKEPPPKRGTRVAAHPPAWPRTRLSVGLHASEALAVHAGRSEGNLSLCSSRCPPFLSCLRLHASSSGHFATCRHCLFSPRTGHARALPTAECSQLSDCLCARWGCALGGRTLGRARYGRMCIQNPVSAARWASRWRLQRRSQRTITNFPCSTLASACLLTVCAACSHGEPFGGRGRGNDGEEQALLQAERGAKGPVHPRGRRRRAAASWEQDWGGRRRRGR